MTLFILGTRPEAIKLAPLILVYKNNKKNYKVCITGQHKDMVKEILGFFDIYIDYDLDIMKDHQSLSYILSTIISSLEKIFMNDQIKCIVVHGDTSSSLAASLWAFQNKIKIIHIESGLRTNNISTPFPEESNRRIISTLSNYSFCPTKQNKINLINENNKSNKFIVGNTIIDAILIILKNKKVTFNNYGDYAVLTTHRRENIGKNMENIFLACNEIYKKTNIKFLFPMHPNPLIFEIFSKIADKNAYIVIQPKRYEEFIPILYNAKFILSDSGGIQEESVFLSKKLFILRDETERKEALLSKNIFLVGTSKKNIVDTVINNFSKKNISLDKHIFGNGKSSIKILKILEKYNDC